MVKLGQLFSGAFRKRTISCVKKRKLTFYILDIEFCFVKCYTIRSEIFGGLSDESTRKCLAKHRIVGIKA